MKSRKQLLAAGSTVTLVAGGVFFSAAPASAVHDSPECITAQSQFTAALHNAGINADLEVELAVALQNLIDAEETLALLTVEGALTLEELEVLVAEAMVKLETEQLPNLNAIINAEGAAGSAVGEAQALLEAVLGGSIDQATADALLDLGINVEDFLLAAALNIDGLTTAINAAVTAGTLTQAQADVLLADLADGELTEANVAALLAVEIDTNDYLLDAEVDLVALEEALRGVIAELELVVEADAATAQLVLELLANGDLEGLLALQTELDVLLGDIGLGALIDLQNQIFAAQAILQAEADVAAAIAVVQGLMIQLEGLDIDLVELEALFEAAIEACTGAAVGGVGGGGGAGGGADGGADDDDDHDYANGGSTTGGNKGGSNRGMNVQTAVPTASTDPAGIGALAAGLGFMVVAGTLAARRVRNS